MIGWPEDDIIDEKIKNLLDIWLDKYPVDVERFYSRAKAEIMISSIVWAYSCRSDQMAGIYAVQQLFDAIGIKEWTFKEDEANILRRYRETKLISESGVLNNKPDCDTLDLITDGDTDALDGLFDNYAGTSDPDA